MYKPYLFTEKVHAQRSIYVVGSWEVLVANIFTMLGSKNTRNSGNCSLALALQHCNFQFFNISEIRVTERVVTEVGFKPVIPCVF